jgi:hypothetical protein
VQVAPVNEAGEWTQQACTIDGEAATLWRNEQTGEFHITQTMQPIASDEPENAAWRWDKGTPRHVKVRHLAEANKLCATNARALRRSDPDLSARYAEYADQAAQMARGNGYAGHLVMSRSVAIPSRTHAREHRPRQTRASRSATNRGDPSTSASSDDPEPAPAVAERLAQEEHLDARTARELIDELRAMGARMAARRWRERRAA